MIIMAYFLLLHPVEYNASTSDSTPFHLSDVTLSCGKTVFMYTSNTTDLKSDMFTMLEFTNQNNGARSKKIGQVKLGGPLLCLTASLLCKILYIKEHNATSTAPVARILSPSEN